MAYRMAWDPLTEEDMAAKGAHAARMLRRNLGPQGLATWGDRSPDARVNALGAQIMEIVRVLGHPGVMLWSAGPHDVEDLAKRGRSLDLRSGLAVSDTYKEAFEDAWASIRDALRSQGVDPDQLPLREAIPPLARIEAVDRATRGLPVVDGMVIDLHVLDGDISQTAPFMETVVQRLAERMDDPDITDRPPGFTARARDWGIAYATEFARELQLEYDPLDTAARPPIERPRFPPHHQSQRTWSQLQRAQEAFPGLSDRGIGAMGRIQIQYDGLPQIAWDARSGPERLHDVRGAIEIARDELNHPDFEVRMADTDEQQMLRSARRVADILPANVSTARYTEGFEASKKCLLDVIERHGVDRDLVDPAKITPGRSPKPTLVVDVENLGGTIEELPTPLQGIAEGIAEDLDDPADAREKGIAFGYGMALMANVASAWNPGAFGADDVVDISSIADVAPGQETGAHDAADDRIGHIDVPPGMYDIHVPEDLADRRDPNELPEVQLPDDISDIEIPDDISELDDPDDPFQI